MTQECLPIVNTIPQGEQVSRVSAMHEAWNGNEVELTTSAHVHQTRQELRSIGA